MNKPDGVKEVVMIDGTKFWKVPGSCEHCVLHPDLNNVHQGKCRTLNCFMEHDAYIEPTEDALAQYIAARMKGI